MPWAATCRSRDHRRERATSGRLAQGDLWLRLHVDDGDKVKRGQRIAEWDPYTRPILTEVGGKIALRGCGRRRFGPGRPADDATGITKRVVIDWRSAPRGADLKPGDRHQGQEGRDALKTPTGGERPLILLSVDAILSVEPGCGRQGRRRRGAYPAGKREDQGHHRWSAAGCRTVRSPPSEGSRHYRRNLRYDQVRPRLQEQAPHHHRAA